MGPHGYRYSMSIPPGTPGQDQFYYLFQRSPLSPLEYSTIARELQKYFRNFISDGSPGGDCFDDAYDGSNVTIPKPRLPYGRNSTWMNISTDDIAPVMGEPQHARLCDLLPELMSSTRNRWQWRVRVESIHSNAFDHSKALVETFPFSFTASIRMWSVPPKPHSGM